uniref:6-phosphofructo-2-kinase domain-containing protein n=1 Tax=Eptatretus burgeri TaxID=7764 RepID=A0A8C4QXW8_EPTBU
MTSSHGRGMKGRSTHITVAPTLVVMVGLPARGKTYMAKKLTRYLNWIGVPTKVFNLGEYRRETTSQASSSFFSPENEEGAQLRRKIAVQALQDVKQYLSEDGSQIAVFDATNTTRDRRDLILAFCVENEYKYFFVESVCNDPKVIEANIMEVKLNNPDYCTCSQEEALLDFHRRIACYQRSYEPLSEMLDKDLPFMKVIDVGRQFLVNCVQEHLQSRVVYYLMHVHVQPHCVLLCRNGESEGERDGRLGGDSDLTSNGEKFASRLSEFVERLGKPHLQVWSSQMRRAVRTAEMLNCEYLQWKVLNELDAGICEDFTYDEFQQKYPSEYNMRELDKYFYRFPRGESYQDLVQRLEPVILELERQENVLVLAHQAVLRCLLAYFLDKSADEMPYLKFPLHTVLKLTPIAYGCRMESIYLDVPAANTHKARSLQRSRNSKPSPLQRRNSFSPLTSPVCKFVGLFSDNVEDSPFSP